MYQSVFWKTRKANSDGRSDWDVGWMDVRSRRKTRKARMSSAGSRIMKVDLKEPSWEEEGLYWKVRKKEVMTEPRRKKDGKVEWKTRSSARPEPRTRTEYDHLHYLHCSSHWVSPPLHLPMNEQFVKHHPHHPLPKEFQIRNLCNPFPHSDAGTVARWIATPCSAKYLWLQVRARFCGCTCGQNITIAPKTNYTMTTKSGRTWTWTWRSRRKGIISSKACEIQYQQVLRKHRL